MENSRTHIEDYSIRRGWAKANVNGQDVDFTFTLSQALEAAIDLKFITEPYGYDNDEVTMTHPLFPDQMKSDGIFRKCKVSTLSVLKELSGDEQNELVQYLAVQQFETII